MELESRFCRSPFPTRNSKARSLRLPMKRLHRNTPTVQVITAKRPRGAIIRIIQVTMALEIAVMMVR